MTSGTRCSHGELGLRGQVVGGGDAAVSDAEISGQQQLLFKLTAGALAGRALRAQMMCILLPPTSLNCSKPSPIATRKLRGSRGPSGSSFNQVCCYPAATTIGAPALLATEGAAASRSPPRNITRSIIAGEVSVASSPLSKTLAVAGSRTAGNSTCVSRVAGRRRHPAIAGRECPARPRRRRVWHLH